MVRLQQRRRAKLSSIWGSFNPTMVRLQPLSNVPSRFLFIPFNPTMVRLQHLSSPQAMLKVGDFQSHYGAIATVAVFVRVLNYFLPFNPTMVRLQLCVKCALCVLYAFNPTMVRLQLLFANSKCTLLNRFQSHYGAIATFLPLFDHSFEKCFQSHYGAIATKVWQFTTFVLISHFQSHYGAIATREGCSQRPTRRRLSIPLWCDCNGYAYCVTFPDISLSIPLWCDCNAHTIRTTARLLILSIPLWCDCNHHRQQWHLHHLCCFQSHYGAIATVTL